MTPARDLKPTRRELQGRGWLTLPGPLFVVELSRGTIAVRPKGARRGGPAEVVLPVGLLYQHGLQARVVPKRRR